MGKRKKRLMTFVAVALLGVVLFGLECTNAQTYPTYIFRGTVYYNGQPAGNATVSFVSAFCCFSPKWNQVCWYHPCQSGDAGAPAYLNVRTNSSGNYYISFEQAGDMQYYVVRASKNGERSPRYVVNSTQTNNVKNLYIVSSPDPPEPPCTPYCP